MFTHLKEDLSAAVVVFLVALPLCLGIAQGSELPVITGVIAGIIGGIVVGALSGSHVSVSGPAAGLITVVIGINQHLGAVELFFMAVLLAGFIQLLLGALKLGNISEFIPNSVIKGMMAAIGLILILKQFPHLIGHDSDFEGDMSFEQNDGKNTFTELLDSWGMDSVAPLIIGIVSLLLLVLWRSSTLKKSKIGAIPAPVLVVLIAILINFGFTKFWPLHQVADKHLVTLPRIEGLGDLRGIVTLPNFSSIANMHVWFAAFQIAIIASLESLLSLEASEKLDLEGRNVDANRELFAQGSGNLLAGLLGALPITSVVVRSTANINSGNKTKLSAILHGFFLLLSLLFFWPIINLIPKAALAAILIDTGYKLTKVSVFKEQYKRGWDAFIPFVITIVAILFTNLLTGILIGLIAGFIFVIRQALRTSIDFTRLDATTECISFGQQISYFIKGKLRNKLTQLESDHKLILDFERTKSFDIDAVEVIHDFIAKNPTKQIEIKGAQPNITKMLKN